MQDNKNIEITAEKEANILHYLVVILKRKKMIAGITIACAVITAIISLIMSPIYQAVTEILPPQQSGSGIYSQVLNQLGSSPALKSNASGLISSTLGLNSQNELYIDMLKSRTMYDYIIDKFGLMKLYKSDYIEEARERLEMSVAIESGKSSIISVSVKDKDPQKAADMANAFIEKLKDLTQTFAVTEASKRRLFFEEQLHKIKEDLIKSEEDLKGLQERTGALDMDEQAKAVIESIADLRAQIAAKEVEIKVMKTFTEPKNPDLQKSEETLRGMKEQLQKLETKNEASADPLMSTAMMPEIGTDYSRKLREIKYNEELFELLARQYEVARVDEARDAIVIQVLDKAEPPTRKVKPKRRLMVMEATFFGFFLSIFVVFFIEYFDNVSSDSKNRELLEVIRQHSLLKLKIKNS
jgi:tyrosine-protein kinase Etk/Wzc